MAYISAVPAYGRDYKTQAQVKADWLAGKDFKDARTGQYLSIRDVANDPDLHVTIRYNNNLRVVTVR